ncbi:MAG: phosphate/phosphite/phosphonate ABC transporter substrate-binding protein [Cyanobacteriota bacterium]|nr:phosphate/phosphite/phosphonate ABC transporter substrate-binding protein [Cyanobacteriota bacterium]
MRNFRSKFIAYAVGLLIVLALKLGGCTGTQPEVTSTETPTSFAPQIVTENANRVSVLGIRSAVKANAEYNGLIDYLSQATDRPFILVAHTLEDQFTQVKQGNVDFVFSNPLAAVQMRRLYGLKFLATLKRPKTGKEFGGLIIVRSDSDLEKLEDLRGKNVVCLNFQTAAGGCNFQIYHLRQKGIDPFADFGSFRELQSQDNIVFSVLNGTFDAGFIRTGQLEKMLAEGSLISLDELRILDLAADDYYYPHTTRLYPEWPFAAMPETDPETIAAVKDALLNASPSTLGAARAEGFVPPIDYTPMDELIETLKLKSWDAPPVSPE